MYSKINFKTPDKIYKQFIEKNTLDILLRIIRFLDIRIILTYPQQIIIVNLDYNASLKN